MRHLRDEILVQVKLHPHTRKHAHARTRATAHMRNARVHTFRRDRAEVVHVRACEQSWTFAEGDSSPKKYDSVLAAPKSSCNMGMHVSCDETRSDAPLLRSGGMGQRKHLWLQRPLRMQRSYCAWCGNLALAHLHGSQANKRLTSQS
jgi:hypothetical protein